MGTFDIGETIGNVVTGGAMGLVNEGLGMALQPLKNRQQYKQQKKLQALQIKGQKELADYQQEQQLEMWNKTNYEAQVGKLKEAGLNAGLLYGMKGGGGVTTGAPIQTGVSGGNAGQAMGIGLGQLAQIDLMKAQARNLDADTQKKLGVDTTKTETEIANLQALTDNTKAKTAFTELQSDYQKLENKIKTDTLDKAIARIEWEADNAFEELQKITRENNLGDEIYKTSVKTYEQQYLKLIAETALTKQQTATGQAQEVAITEENRLNIKRTLEGIEQKWAEINNNATGKNIHDTNEYKELVNTIGVVGASAVISILTKGKAGSIGGFGKGMIKK